MEIATLVTNHSAQVQTLTDENKQQQLVANSTEAALNGEVTGLKAIIASKDQQLTNNQEELEQVNIAAENARHSLQEQLQESNKEALLLKSSVVDLSDTIYQL